VNASGKIERAPEEAGLWPALPFSAWEDTCATLHMWTQIVGKTRMALSPLINHWWNVTLYVTARGLTTSLIPYAPAMFDVEFDFISHGLRIRTTSGREELVRLYPRTVADFYAEYMGRLRALGIDVKITRKPSEVPDPVPFDHDTVHASYDAAYATRFWHVLTAVSAVFDEFRARFTGKSSPVHFFWGSFDLAVTRFSGRAAPERPGADQITKEGYSHECSSCGFWPGDRTGREAAFFAYTAPAPAGLERAAIGPEAARWNDELGMFLLGYDPVRSAPAPREALLEFCQSAYDAGATLAGWPRETLERR